MSALRKNVASQVVTFCLVNATTGAALTGASVTTKVTLDGTQSASAGTLTELGSGQYKYVPTQGETNGASVGFLFTATNAVPVNLHCFTIGQDPTAATFDVNVTKLLGTAVATPATAGVIDVNVKNAGNVAWASGAIVAGAIATGAITNAKFAAGAIDAASLSTDAKTDIAYTVWEENVAVHTFASAGQKLHSAEYNAALMVDGGDYTGVVNKIWDEDATAHTSLGSTGQYLGLIYDVDAVVDTISSTVNDIPLIKAQTDLIVPNPALVSDIPIADIALIKAKTDNLPASPAAVGDIPTAAAIADANWDEARAGHVAAGSFGENVVADVTKVGGNAASISPTAGLLNARVTEYSVAATAAMGVVQSGNPVASVTNPVAVNSLANNVVTSAALDATAVNEIADGLLDRTNGIDIGLTPRHALELAAASVLQKLTGAGTGTERVRNFADTADLATITVDGSGNKSAIIYDFSI